MVSTPVRIRTAADRFGLYGLAFDRSVSFSVYPLDTVSGAQNGYQVAYSAGLALHYSYVDTYQRRQDAPSQHPGSFVWSLSPALISCLIGVAWISSDCLRIIRPTLFFVSRAKSNTKFKLRYSNLVDRANSLSCALRQVLTRQ